ncbi:hypothetical protein F2Q70_00017283 [Brassica cretica]|uniref:Chlorophyll a-b binding protein, chloroplastic n=1 Tax=Brassica cretica TaxID=69181 RepID=A0A8S9I5U1_BRACR|nr:hypothetical protein F2Q70_00017283 [Brassica cretica]
MASLGVSEMLGTPLNFRAVSRSSAPLASNPATFKTVALFSKKKPAPPPKAKTVSAANDELAKWYGPDRRIFLPDGLLDRSEIPEYLNGEVAGDYGYDPFGLGKKPENFAKYQAFELIHARWAMLGAAGFIIPEAFNKYGANCGPEAVWFKTGALLLDGNTLNYFGKNIPINLVLAVVAEVVLLGGAEYYRIPNGLKSIGFRMIFSVKKRSRLPYNSKYLRIVRSTVRLLRMIVPRGKPPILAPFFTLLPSALWTTPDLK